MPKFGLFCLAVLAIMGRMALAQVSVFNVPTGDTQPKGTFVLEGDFEANSSPFNTGGFRAYGVSTIYGLNDKTDIGANFFVTRSEDGAIRELQVHAKRVLYSSDRRRTSISAGGLAFFPIHDRFGERSGLMLYSSISKQLTIRPKPRVTGGGYTVIRGDRRFGTRGGVMLGVEQPIWRKLSFLADWLSGHNKFGYSAAGVTYAITSRQYLTAGYYFGNADRKNNALWVYYGYTFE